MKVRKAVIPAAGLGTRFLPATKAQPKEMLPLIDKPAIQYVVEEAVEAGITDILIVTGRGKRSIEDHFDRSFELEHYLESRRKFDELKQVRSISEMATIHYTRQGDPLGLGHAVAVAEDYVGDEPFAAVDPVLAHQLGNWLRAAAHRRGATVVIVMHQIDAARALADRIVGLRNGAIAFDGPSPAFDAAAQARVFAPAIDVSPFTSSPQGLA